MTFEKAMKLARKQNPGMDEEELTDLVHQWMADAAEEAANREDTPCLDEPWWRQP